MADPLGVRASTAWILGRARFVRLDPDGLTRVTKLVQKQIQKNKLLTQSQFGSRQVGPQLVFLQDVNFCFWAPKGKPKWGVEYPAGERWNGWYAFTACFERALEEGIPILDASFLAHLTIHDTAHIFRGITPTPIPLLPRRHQFLKDAGSILLQNWQGSVERFLDDVGINAAHLAQAIITHFPSFEDVAYRDGRRITFYKRAQICVYDLSMLPGLMIKNLNTLTAFADYKLPQLLRHNGAIHYEQSLARRIDAKEHIAKGSREEVEIRAATVWACELIAQELGVPAVLVDNVLWLTAATTSPRIKPYHRTLTTSY